MATDREINQYDISTLRNAEKAAQVMSTIPKEKENMFLAVTESWLSGLDAGLRIAKEEKEEYGERS